MFAWALLCLLLLVRAFAGGVLSAVPRGAGPWRSVRVDLNRAGVAELCTLPGIGRQRAEAIVVHRIRRGWFRDGEDLQQVDGLGADTVRALLPFALFGAPGDGRARLPTGRE